MVIDIEPEVKPIDLDDLKELQFMLAQVDMEEESKQRKNKIKVLLLYIVYPLAMGTYFKRALERRNDVDLKVAGVYTGSWIPWKGGMEVAPKVCPAS